eukprot:g18763.t1
MLIKADQGKLMLVEASRDRSRLSEADQYYYGYSVNLGSSWVIKAGLTLIPFCLSGPYLLKSTSEKSLKYQTPKQMVASQTHINSQMTCTPNSQPASRPLKDSLPRDPASQTADQEEREEEPEEGRKRTSTVSLHIIDSS